MKTLICKLDPKNSGIIYRVISKSLERSGFNDFEYIYKLETIYPKKWGVESSICFVSERSIIGENAYYQIIS
jgi:hypothetical protein